MATPPRRCRPPCVAPTGGDRSHAQAFFDASKIARGLCTSIWSIWSSLTPALRERRQDVVGDVVVVPERPGPALAFLRQHVGPAVGVVREHHLAGVALGAELGHHLDPLGGRQEVLQAEAVHPDRAPPLHQPAQVGEVLAVAAVADDDATQVDALLGEDRLLQLAGAAGGPGVGRDRHAGGLLGAGGGAQDVVDHRGHAGGVGRALDDGGLHATGADALRDVADEQLGHCVHAVGAEVALRHPPDAGGDDDVHLRAAGHRGDQVDVAAEIDGGQVDEAANAPAVEVGQLALGDVEDGVAIPEVGPVLLHAGRARDDVLVHQRRSQLGRVHRSAGGLHRCHGRLPRVV